MITKTANPKEATAVVEGRILARICKMAPNAPLGEAQQLAHEFAIMDQEKWDLEMVLVVLSSVLLDHDGRVRTNLKIDDFEKNPTLKWAFKKMSYQHAAATCGPVHDGVGYCIAQLNERLKGSQE